MKARLQEISAIVQEAATVAKAFPFSPDLGVSELIHDQRRAGLSILLGQIDFRINALILAGSQDAGTPNVALSSDQVAAVKRYLVLATNTGAAAPDRWNALEALKAEAQRILS